jgi:hypothetical protein
MGRKYIAQPSAFHYTVEFAAFGAGLDWYNGLRRIKCENGDWGN